MSDAHLMVPPHSADSEAAVLGALLLDNAAIDKVADLINEDDFYTRDNRMIFAAISTMLQRNQPVDIVTLAEYLESRRQLDDCGGVQAIASMVQNTPSAANIRHYAQRVVDKSILRKVASEADAILMRAYHAGDATGASMLDEAQGKFMAISQRVEKNASSMQGITQVVSQLADHIDENFTKRQAGNDDLVIGLETGLRDLDKMTTGLQGGDFVIVAGRPSMGKTAFAINIAEHVALSLGKPTLIFSLEMSNKQLTNRMLAGVAKVNSQRIWTGRIYDHEWERLTAGIGRLNEAPVHMDDDASLNVNDIKARARRLHRETGGLALIVIDYLQLIAASNARGNRVEDLSEISRELKRLAKELDIPVIALSQLSRAVEQRPNKRPVMSDLRESGAIEQDADVIMFVYRDEYYNPDSQDKGTAEIIIGKQRNGPVGTIRVNFTKNITKFSDMETPSYMGGDDE